MEKQNELNNEKTKKSSKLIVRVVIILVLIIVLGGGVYFAYTKGLLDNIISKSEKIESNESNEVKTYEFKLGNYCLITEETEKFKDGQEIKLDNIVENQEDENELYKVVLIKKGLYDIETMQANGGLIYLSKYVEKENQDLEKTEDNRNISDGISFDYQFKKFSQRPIVDKINILQVKKPVRYQKQYIDYPEKLNETEPVVKLTLLDKELTDKSLKTGTKIYLDLNTEIGEYYEVGKNIPEGTYDLVLEEGKYLSVQLDYYTNGEYGFTSTLKNEGTDKRVIIHDLELKNENRLSLNSEDSVTEGNPIKILLVSKDKLEQEFVPLEKTQEDTN